MAGAKDVALRYSDFWPAFAQFSRLDLGPLVVAQGLDWDAVGPLRRSAATLGA